MVRIVSGPDDEKLAADEFPAPLDGQAFDDLLDSIRALVAGTGAYVEVWRRDRRSGSMDPGGPPPSDHHRR